MPFGQQRPRPFTAPSVRTYAPAASGVYGISNASEWIYIGAAENIQAALLYHLMDSNKAVLDRAPTGFVFEACDLAMQPDRQDRLVLEYEPTCNRHWSRHRGTA